MNTASTCSGGHQFKQPGHGRVTKVDQEPEIVVLNQEPAACLARFGPRTTPAKNRKPHRNDPNRRGRDAAD